MMQSKNSNEKSLVWVVVLNWNQPIVTYQCVKSILQSTYPCLKIVVVDNGSEFINYEKLQKKLLDFPVEIIRSDHNLGFAEGNNIGIQHSLVNGAEYILLINNDTIIDDSMIAKLVDVLQQDQNLGIVGPIIYYLEEPTRVWFAGYRIPGRLYVIRRGIHIKLLNHMFEEVDFISGCGMMIRRQLLEQIGLLPNEYFMYYEDLEYCIKAKMNGWRIACVPSAKMWHAVSLSSGGPKAIKKEYYQVRSSLLFFQRNTKGLTFIINVTLRLSQAFVNLIKALFSGKLTLSLIIIFIKGFYKSFQKRSKKSNG